MTSVASGARGLGEAARRARPARMGTGGWARPLLFLTLVALLGACAPGAFGPAASTDPVATELERTAQVLYHRMELGLLETGVYTTNALIDVKLPEGARWTLQEFATDGSSYLLVLRSSRLASTAWRVSPRGVSRFNPG
ncbi:MAG: hypothetical protein KF875_01145 [Trueperaceae bacterium]|nr:hypothetical protein [Trueperaceae bacterium]MCO5172719.1 hypothetical protein [Trueperaceae bacterium]MCW5820937.1 hypothetical protein [Trueperaceae bacterium]